MSNINKGIKLMEKFYKLREAGHMRSHIHKF